MGSEQFRFVVGPHPITPNEWWLYQVIGGANVYLMGHTFADPDGKVCAQLYADWRNHQGVTLDNERVTELKARVLSLQELRSKDYQEYVVARSRHDQAILKANRDIKNLIWLVENDRAARDRFIKLSAHYQTTPERKTVSAYREHINHRAALDDELRRLKDAQT